MDEKARVGFAQREISPRLGEEMAGYGFYLNRRGARHLDPLKARAVSLASGEERCVVVQLDLIGLSKEFVGRVRRRAQQRFGLAASQLMLHCTDTHSGPTTYPYIGCGRLCVDYLTELEDELIELLQAVLDRMEPANRCLRFQEPCEPIAFLRSGAGTVDSRVRGLFFEPGNGSPIGIVSHGCHPVVLGRNDSFSADYPGRFLEELNAYGVRAVFLNEPCGDLDPLSNACQWGGGSERTLEIYGRDLAEATFRGLKKGETCSFSEIETVSRDCKLEGVVPDKAEREAAKKTASEELERDASNGLARVELEWISMLEERVNRGGLSKEMRLEVQAFRVDDTLVVGLAGEVFSSLAKEVRDAFPGRFMLLAGTCNGLLGYVPSRSDVVSGGYASRVAPKIYGMLCPTPAAGEALMDQVVETIQGLQFEPKA